AVPPESCAFTSWLLHHAGEEVLNPAGHVLPPGDPLLVSWRDSPKKPVLSSHNSVMFRYMKTTKIPPPGCKFTLLHSPTEQEIEEPREGMAKKEEDHVETKGQDDGNGGPTAGLRDRVLTSLECSTGPLDPHHPEDSLSEKAQMSPMSSSGKATLSPPHTALLEMSCLLGSLIQMQQCSLTQPRAAPAAREVNKGGAG
ncbi:hypothetical protein HPG69_007690, partial [Diceros bicornis minor]